MLKKSLRKKILLIRKKKFNSNSIVTLKNFLKVFKKKNLKNSILGFYYPVNYEINCFNLLNEFQKTRNKIALPVIKRKNQMDFFLWNTKDPLISNKYGIPEPIRSKIVYPDILIVPIVGFDKHKFRLGYGGGFYDRYLNKLNKKKKFLSIGIAFSFQKIKNIPIDKYDQKLDIIITERSIIK